MHPVALCLACIVLVAGTASASATQRLPREPDVLRPGQKVLVDDGTCPLGKIKEVIGGFAAQTLPGQVKSPDGRIRRCVNR